MLSANLRIALREQQYGQSFLRVRAFRLVYQLQPVMVQELCGLSIFRPKEQGHQGMHMHMLKQYMALRREKQLHVIQNGQQPMKHGKAFQSC